MSDAITNGIHTHVECQYLEDESSPEKDNYIFTYRITISNHSQRTVQLLGRHWVITNADGITEEVEGPGVVGQQPVIRPGQSFNYSSFCPLNTPIGTMQGTYQIMTESQETFDAVIAPFTLAKPGILQ